MSTDDAHHRRSSHEKLKMFSFYRIFVQIGMFVCILGVSTPSRMSLLYTNISAAQFEFWTLRSVRLWMKVLKAYLCCNSRSGLRLAGSPANEGQTPGSDSPSEELKMKSDQNVINFSGSPVLYRSVSIFFASSVSPNRAALIIPCCQPKKQRNFIQTRWHN